MFVKPIIVTLAAVFVWVGFGRGFLLAQSIVEVRVSGNFDDAEEDAGGGMSRTNDKLELGQQAWVGFRFRNVAIPQGVTITGAYIELRAADSNSENTDLTIFGQDEDDPEQFSNGRDNISKRPRTAASVAWNNIPNWSSGNTYQSPDIAAIIQEIVDRSGWSSGNEMVIVLRSDDFDGKRLVVAHDDQPSQAALLHLEYGEADPLVARWRFDDGSGGTAADAAGDNDGSILGIFAWETRCDSDGYLDLAGGSSYVHVPEDSSLDISGDATIAGWFKLNADFDETSSTSQVLLAKYASDDENLHIVLAGDDYDQSAVPEGSLVVKTNGTSGAYRYIWSAQTQWKADQWYHFAITLNANSPASNTLYIDGIDDTAGSSGTTAYNDISFSADIDIGGGETENTPGPRYLDGAVDDFRLYSYRLTGSEVAELYGLILHWKLDEVGGNTAFDSSGMGLDGTSTGVTFASGRIDGAYELDGSSSRIENLDLSDNLNGLEEITVLVWIKSDVSDHDRGIFFTDEPSGSDNRMGMRYDKDGWAGGGERLIKASIHTTSGSTSIESSENAQTSSWQHLALVWRSGESLQLYINGQLDSLTHDTGPLSGTVNNVDRLLVGVGAKDKTWQGLIDEFRIYNRALCSDQIDAIYGSGLPQGVRIIKWVEVK